ncbi:MAG: hypothetical protein ACHQLQ_15200 [Candidatus Acidiferrales bacterium]
MLQRFAFTLAFLLIGAFSVSAQGPSRFTIDDPTSRDKTLPIVVFVRRIDSSLEFVLEDFRYTGDQLAFKLGELALERGKDRQIVVILEDSVLMSDFKEVPFMAINAGFRDVRVFLTWKKSRKMAEVILSRKTDDLSEFLFGPVRKKTKDPKKF